MFSLAPAFHSDTGGRVLRSNCRRPFGRAPAREWPRRRPARISASACGAAVIAYRLAHDRFVHHVASAQLPTAEGLFELHGFRDDLANTEHVALTMGTIDDGAPVLVRMHSECLTGDALHSLRCDCGAQRDAALAAIAAEGRGVLVYLRQEGRGIGLLNKIRAYALQDQGVDTVEANLRLSFAADLRDYGVGAQMLHHLGVRRLKLLTNNPRKIVGLSGFDRELAERGPLHAGKKPHDERSMWCAHGR